MRNLIVFIALVFSYNCSQAQYFPEFNDTIHSSMVLNKIIYSDSVYYVINTINEVSILKISHSGALIESKIVDSNKIKYLYGHAEAVQTSNGFLLFKMILDTNSVKFCYMAELNYDLDTLWTKCLYRDSTYSIYQNLHISDIRQTPDGGFIIGGFSYDSVPSAEAFIVKIDKFGNKQWSKRYSGINTLECMELTPDMGILFHGYDFNNSYMIKTTALGSITWKKKIKSRRIFGPYADLKLSGDGCFVLARGKVFGEETSTSNIYPGLNLVKINYTTGQFVFDTIYQIYNGFPWHGKYTLNVLSNDRILVSGVGYVPVGLVDGVVTVFESNGDSICTHLFSYGSPGEFSSCNLIDVVVTPDGGFVGCGTVIPYNANSISWIFKYNPYWATNILNTNKLQLSLKCFPNPTDGKFRIEFEEPTLSSLIINLFNQKGKLLYSGEVFRLSKSFDLDLSTYSSGLYIVEVVKDNTKIYSGKIIKE